MVEVAEDERERSADGFSLWIVFCFGVAFLLFTAAALKAWNAPVVIASEVPSRLQIASSMLKKDQPSNSSFSDRFAPPWLGSQFEEKSLPS